MAGPAVSEEVARAWRQRQVEIDGCQNRTRLIGLLAPDDKGEHFRTSENALPFAIITNKAGAVNAPALRVLIRM